jgi:ABC-type Fe3+-hydroxamate transport system substrate-binding protein
MTWERRKSPLVRRATKPDVPMKQILLFLVTITSILPCAASRLLIDETRRSVSVPDHPHCIICFVPSITDSVFSIGAGNDVVAISDYVKYPAEAQRKPSVGSISNPSMETILSLHPDLVLGMPQATQKSTLDQIEKLGIPVFLVDPHGIAGILHSILSLGQVTDREAQANALVKNLNSRIAAVRESVRDKPVIQVFAPVSYDPVITVGKGAFITEFIEAAGGPQSHRISRRSGPDQPGDSRLASSQSSPACSRRQNHRGHSQRQARLE